MSQPNLPTPNFNRQKVDFDLKSLLSLFGDNLLFNMNCHAIGTVQTFDSSNQTATVTVNYTKVFFVPDPNALATAQEPTYIQQSVDYPLIIDCPVVILSGGPSHLTFPITKGDECLVLFNDRDIDNWFATGQVAPPATGRLHSFSDALVLVGLKSTLKSITNYDTVRAIISNGNVKVGINPSTNKATILNNTTTLNTVLQNILTQIENLSSAIATLTVTGVTSGGSLSGVPSNAATFTTIASNLTSLATTLGGLLE